MKQLVYITKSLLTADRISCNQNMCKTKFIAVVNSLLTAIPINFVRDKTDMNINQIWLELN